MTRLNNCRFCDHHYICHILSAYDMPDCEWTEGKCNYTDCKCTEYGSEDNLKFLEEKYDRNNTL